MIDDSLIWVTICFHLRELDCWFDFFPESNWQPWMSCQRRNGACDGFNFHVIHEWSGCCWCLLWASFCSYTPVLSDFLAIPFSFSCLYLDFFCLSIIPPFVSDLFLFPFSHIHGFNTCFLLILDCTYHFCLLVQSPSYLFWSLWIPFNDLVMIWTNSLIFFFYDGYPPTCFVFGFVGFCIAIIPVQSVYLVVRPIEHKWNIYHDTWYLYSDQVE